MSKLADALFPRATRAVLGAIFLHPEGLHLRGLVAATGLGSASTQRELGKLTEAGILKREEVGRLLVYRANQASPVYAELHSILAKTTGLAPQLAAQLAPFSARIEQAFIYGSVARGEEDAGSDVDIMVIAHDLGSADLYPGLIECEKTFGRKISLKVYRPDEFQKKLAAGNHFLVSVMNGPRIELFSKGGALEGTRQPGKGGAAQA